MTDREAGLVDPGPGHSRGGDGRPRHLERAGPGRGACRSSEAVAFLAAALCAASAGGDAGGRHEARLRPHHSRRPVPPAAGPGAVGAGIPAPVLDALVIDRHVDRYRRGRRTLVDLCALYGVEIANAHDAAADAEAAMQVLLAVVPALPRDLGPGTRPTSTPPRSPGTGTGPSTTTPGGARAARADRPPELDWPIAGEGARGSPYGGRPEGVPHHLDALALVQHHSGRVPLVDVAHQPVVHRVADQFLEAARELAHQCGRDAELLVLLLADVAGAVVHGDPRPGAGRSRWPPRRARGCPPRPGRSPWASRRPRCRTAREDWAPGRTGGCRAPAGWRRSPR